MFTLYRSFEFYAAQEYSEAIKLEQNSFFTMVYLRNNRPKFIYFDITNTTFSGVNALTSNVAEPNDMQFAFIRLLSKNNDDELNYVGIIFFFLFFSFLHDSQMK